METMFTKKEISLNARLYNECIKEKVYDIKKFRNYNNFDYLLENKSVKIYESKLDKLVWEFNIDNGKRNYNKYGSS